jgi:hypothetical protein
MINMNYFSKYSSELGFRVGVECLHQLEVKEKPKDQGLYAVIATLNPPASFYDLKRADGPSDVISAFTDIDWNSTNHSVRFKEGMYQVEKIEPFVGMNIIFDIKKMDLKTQTWNDYGWTLLPLFKELETDMDKRTSEFYMQSGIFALPVFKGRVSIDLVKNVTNSKDPWGRLNAERLGRGIFQMDPTTIIVKVVDNQREVRTLTQLILNSATSTSRSSRA